MHQKHQYQSEQSRSGSMYDISLAVGAQNRTMCITDIDSMCSIPGCMHKTPRGESTNQNRAHQSHRYQYLWVHDQDAQEWRDGEGQGAPKTRAADLSLGACTGRSGMGRRRRTRCTKDTSSRPISGCMHRTPSGRETKKEDTVLQRHEQ